MKTCVIIIMAVLAGAWAGAQNYGIGKSTLDSGGGTSEGGKFRVNGTVGQPEASDPATGGRFTIRGGFWHGVIGAVQTEGAPRLRIVRKSRSVVELTWEDPDNRFRLQQSETMKGGSWSFSALPVDIAEGKRTIRMPVPHQRRFFRLVRAER